MVPDEVGGDAVQPGPRVRASLVIGVPLAKGEQEGLRHDVIGRIPADAAHHVALYVRRVPAEQHGEVLRLMPGELNNEQHGEVLRLMPGELNNGRVTRVRAGLSLGPALLRHA
jgi:hypothetical protein